MTVDEEFFDRWQIAFGIAMARDIRDELIRAGIRGEALREATGRILFMVSARIDGAHEVEVAGDALFPVVYITRDTGEVDEQGREVKPVLDLIGGSDQSTSLHDYAFGNVDWLLDEGDPAT
jgi:hypothetical protein